MRRILRKTIPSAYWPHATDRDLLPGLLKGIGSSMSRRSRESTDSLLCQTRVQGKGMAW